MLFWCVLLSLLTLSYIGPPFAELIHWASEVAAKQRKYFMMSRPKIKPVGGHYSRMFISYVVQTSVLIGDHKLGMVGDIC